MVSFTVWEDQYKCKTNLKEETSSAEKPGNAQMLGHMQNFLHAYWMIRPTHTWSNLILLFTFAQPALSSFSSFVAAPLISPSPLQRLSLTCTPTPPPPPNASTLLSPLVPVAPSQTNGAHYSRSKNSRCCHLIYFSPPFRLSLSLLPFRKSLRCSSFSAPPRGGKWVTARRLVSSFISWRNRVRLSESEGCGGTVGASRPSPSAARLSRSLLYGRGATGQKVKMNQWPVFIRRLEKQRTSP